MTIEMAFLLLSPLIGAAVLALAGHRSRAPEINSVFCFTTFAAAAALVARVVADGPRSALDNLLFVDSLNVFLVALTAFVAMTTSIFSRPYMRIEREHGRVSAAGMPRSRGPYSTFCRSVSHGKSAYSWNTTPRSAPGRSIG